MLFWPTRFFTLQRFASVYRNVVFLHFYAESNEMTKYLDQVRLKVERHPHFAFFRNGKCMQSMLQLFAGNYGLHAAL